MSGPLHCGVAVRCQHVLDQRNLYVTLLLFYSECFGWVAVGLLGAVERFHRAVAVSSTS